MGIDLTPGPSPPSADRQGEGGVMRMGLWVDPTLDVTFLLAQKSNQKKAAANETARWRRGFLDWTFVVLW